MMKINIERDVIEQALVALENPIIDITKERKAIAALREVLEQPVIQELKTCACGEPTYGVECSLCDSSKGLFKSFEAPQPVSQEPVAYYVKFGRRVSDNMQVVFDDNTVVYTEPLPTKFDIDKLHAMNMQYVECPACGSDMAMAYSPKQEPVAEVNEHGRLILGLNWNQVPFGSKLYADSQPVKAKSHG